MDEYTVRIEVNGVERWRSWFEYNPSRNAVYERLGVAWERLSDEETRSYISQCYAILQRCNSIPGQCPMGRIYLDHVWKLVA